MKPEEINIAIAESLGWERLDGTDKGMLWPCNSYVTGKDGSIMKPCGVTHRHGVKHPNYHGDLNSCAEFEKALDNDQKTDYIRLLNKCDFSYRRLAFATAPQRCEAYLRTLGKWKEDA